MAHDLQDIDGSTKYWFREPNWKSSPKTNPVLSRILRQFSGTRMGLYARTENVPWRRTFGFMNKTKAEEFEMISFFEDRRAMVEGFWIPDWSSSFIVLEDILDSTSVTVRNDLFYQKHKGYERIAFIMPDGDVISRKIEDAERIDDDEEQLTLSSGPGTILLTDYAHVTLFRLVRFEMDKLTVKYHTTGVSEAMFKLFELVTEYPE